MNSGIFLILMFNAIILSSITNRFSWIPHFFNYITIFILLLITVIGYGGLIFSILYKYTTATYVLIPVASLITSYLIFSSFNSSLPVFCLLGINSFIIIILYSFLTFLFPVHVLRKLNNRTILISSLTTIISAFSSQIFKFLSTNYFKNEHYLLNIKKK